jgi:predicted AlkP superfamily pyrophosphatase or phosphodiesterase
MSMLNSASLLRRLLPALGLAGLAIGGIHAAPQSPARDRHVVLVSLDGFTAEAMKDPRLPAPTLRRLMREGTSAAALRIVNPALTWPNHTTMVTGVQPARHGVLYNGLLVRPPGAPPRVEPWRDKREMVKAPTVYDRAHAAGLTTAQVDWVAIYEADTITWAFPERPDPAGAIERELVESGRRKADEIASFRGTSSAYRDQVWTDAAIHILERHKPNLLLFHLLALDGTHHTYGPGTSAGSTAMAFLDAQLGRLLEAVERAGLADRTSVIVVSDHGFRTARRTIQPNVVLREQGLIAGEGTSLRADAWTMPWGGSAGIYLRDAGGAATLVPKIAAMMQPIEGVARVMTGDEIASLGLPLASQSDQAPDLVLAAAEGYDFGRRDTGEVVAPVADDHRGHHGALNTDPSMRAVFVAWGRGVAKGGRLKDVRAVDVAPTIAEWLGVDLPNVEGTSLARQLAGAQMKD